MGGGEGVGHAHVGVETADESGAHVDLDSLEGGVVDGLFLETFDNFVSRLFQLVDGFARVRDHEEDVEVVLFAAGEGGVGRRAQGELLFFHQFLVHATGAALREDAGDDIEDRIVGV